MAAGGLVSSPQLSLIGEAGKEMVIPLERQERGRALWMQAGEMLGMISKAGGAMATPKPIPEFRGSGMPLYKAAEGLSSGDTVNNTANHSQHNGGDTHLHITVNGGGEGGDSIAQKIAEEVRRVLRETQEYNQRTSYA
jgi:SLT domain-containing protein